MSKLSSLLLLGVCLQAVSGYSQVAQLSGPLAAGDGAMAQAAEAARKAGLRDVMTYPKQSFAVSWNGVRLGTFLSLGGRVAGAPYQCVQSFVPADASAAASMVITAGAGKLGTDICDHPRAVGVLPADGDQVRIGVLYANSDYAGGGREGGAEAPPVSVALLIDAKTRRMTLDERATEVLQKAGPGTWPAMRALFEEKR